MPSGRSRGARAFVGRPRRLAGALAVATVFGLAAVVLPSALSPARAGSPTLPDFGPGTSWVSYGHSLPQPAAVTAADMAVLKAHGATGIITYTTMPGYDDAAQIAISLGMKVILGIYNPNNQTEDFAAVALAKAHPSSVQGIVVGNEGLCWSEYSYSDLVAKMAWLRQRLGDSVPLSTSEPLQVYVAAYHDSTADDLNCHPGTFPGLLHLGDFLSPNLLPESCISAVGAHNIASELGWLQSVSGMPVFGHEVDVLTNPGYCSQQDQRDFFCTLRSYTNSFSHFTAFDELAGGIPLRNAGLFTSARQPKLAGLVLGSC